MNSKWLIFAALWIATLAAAYFVGHGSTEAIAPQSVDSPTSYTAKVAAGAQGAGDAQADNLAVGDTLAAAEAKLEAGSALDELLAGGGLSQSDWMKVRLEALSYNSSQLNDALSKVLQMPAGRERNQLVYELLSRWGSLDPVNALEYVSTIQSMEMRSRGMGEVLEGWATRDPVSAINWLNTNGNELSARTYGNYLEGIIEGYALNNAQSAFEYVSALPSGTVADRRIKDGAMREVIDVMVEQNQIDQALALSLAMEDVSSRNGALEKLVNEWADRDPQAAKEFVDSMADDPAYADMQRSLLRSWADDDPEAAAAWLSTLDPETTDQARLATSLVANWTRYDMEAAANWLNSLPPTPDLDRAVAIYSMNAAQDDPATALTWANSVSNDQSRERLEQRILPMLREQDNEAFEAYLADSDYSDDKKQQYRELEVGNGRGGRGGWGGGGRR